MTTAMRWLLAALLMVVLAPGCRGDDQSSGDKKGESAQASPAQGDSAGASASPSARERPTLKPPESPRPPADFNRPPAVLPTYKIELDTSGRQVTYEVGSDGDRQPVAE